MNGWAVPKGAVPKGAVPKGAVPKRGGILTFSTMSAARTRASLEGFSFLLSILAWMDILHMPGPVVAGNLFTATMSKQAVFVD
jgi:hypothetical protein